MWLPRGQLKYKNDVKKTFSIDDDFVRIWILIISFCDVIEDSLQQTAQQTSLPYFLLVQTMPQERFPLVTSVVLQLPLAGTHQTLETILAHTDLCNSIVLFIVWELGEKVWCKIVIDTLCHFFVALGRSRQQPRRRFPDGHNAANLLACHTTSTPNRFTII